MPNEASKGLKKREANWILDRLCGGTSFLYLNDWGADFVCVEAGHRWCDAGEARLKQFDEYKQPLLRSVSVAHRYITMSDLADHVAGSHAPGLDDLRIDSSEMQGFSSRRVGEAHGILAVALCEFFTAVVGLRRRFKNHRAYRQSLAGLEVFVAQIKIDVEVVAGQRPTALVLRNQVDKACIGEGKAIAGK